METFSLIPFSMRYFSEFLVKPNITWADQAANEVTITGDSTRLNSYIKSSVMLKASRIKTNTAN